MKYNVLEEEKRNISKIITSNRLSKLNYILDSFDNNALETIQDPEKSGIYRELLEYTKMYMSASRGIIKNFLNEYEEKKQIEKEYGNKIDLTGKKQEYIYIYMTIQEFEEMFKTSKGARVINRKILVGKNNLEIVKEELRRHLEEMEETVNNADQLIDDYLIIKLSKDEDLISYTTTEEFKDVYTEVVLPIHIIEFDAFLIENSINKIKNIRKTRRKLEMYKESQNTEALDAVFGKTEEINTLQEKIEKLEIIPGKIYNSESAENIIKRAANIDETELVYLENKDKLEQFLVSSVEVGTHFKKYAKVIEDIKELQNDIKVSELMEYKAAQNDEESEEIEEIKKRTVFFKEELNNKEKMLKELEVKILEFKKTYEEKIKDYAKYIALIKLEEIKYKEAGIGDLEKVKLIELDKIIRINKSKVEDILEKTTNLIKKQQKYAKIGAETNAKYSSLIDGFEIKNEAEKLKAVLNDMSKRFNEYYFNKLNGTGFDLEYEKNLGKILEVSAQVEIFINYIFNPKNTKKRTDLNRFDELALIEENEIKRKITREVDEIIAQANLLIIDDEIDAIETKKAIEKILDLLTGKHKIDKYRQMKLEELAELVDAKLNQTYTLNRNYKIHDVLAKIMIFKAENITDELVEEQSSKITKIEKAIVRNFVIQENKVLEKIDELKMLKLPTLVENKTEEDEIDSEISLLRHKYGYDSIQTEEEIKFVDTTASEIKKIIEYIKTGI